jgi:hypothetical protein
MPPATPDALAGSDGVVIQVEARVAVVAIVTIGAAFHARLSGAAARFTPSLSWPQSRETAAAEQSAAASMITKAGKPG